MRQFASFWFRKWQLRFILEIAGLYLDVRAVVLSCITDGRELSISWLAVAIELLLEHELPLHKCSCLELRHLLMFQVVCVFWVKYSAISGQIPPNVFNWLRMHLVLSESPPLNSVSRAEVWGLLQVLNDLLVNCNCIFLRDGKARGWISKWCVVLSFTVFHKWKLIIKISHIKI